MKILFAGTPEIAQVILAKLYATNHDIVAVLTQPDRPAGRGQKLQMSAVKQFAITKGLKVLQPESLKTTEVCSLLQAFDADLMIVVAYGLIVPKVILNIPRFGCWNVHVSLLPRWRGAAPIQRAIEAGDAETGVSIMQMDEGLDTGAVLLQEKTPIFPSDTALSLHDRLAHMGSQALLKALEQLQLGTLQAQAQDEHGATYAHKLMKEEGRLDFSLSALELERRIRAFYPWPMTFMFYNGESFKIGEAMAVDLETEGPLGLIVDVNPEFILVQCAQGCLRIHALQKPGSKMLSVREFLNGYPNYFVVGSEVN